MTQPDEWYPAPKAWRDPAPLHLPLPGATVSKITYSFVRNGVRCNWTTDDLDYAKIYLGEGEAEGDLSAVGITLADGKFLPFSAEWIPSADMAEAHDHEWAEDEAWIGRGPGGGWVLCRPCVVPGCDAEDMQPMPVPPGQSATLAGTTREVR